ncbi:hypothetical protein PanWU01x14_257630 [Parasponia andersonii]|uniref:Transmembrane protein n=1 Tax=Parasponia andersonii TaxID=3476 RepID=A0A2P5BA35_PARAD|nr:hypothetical protein PanWU01x14_257630 [Parasponia andersonii]
MCLPFLVEPASIRIACLLRRDLRCSRESSSIEFSETASSLLMHLAFLVDSFSTFIFLFLTYFLVIMALLFLFVLSYFLSSFSSGIPQPRKPLTSSSSSGFLFARKGCT